MLYLVSCETYMNYIHIAQEVSLLFVDIGLVIGLSVAGGVIIVAIVVIVAVCTARNIR